MGRASNKRKSYERDSVQSEGTVEEQPILESPISGIYKWSSPLSKEDKVQKYYDCIKIKLPKQDEFLVHTGDSVLFQSEESVPFIGAIDQLFEVKVSGRKCVRVRWFFRQGDVKNALPHALDNIRNLSKNEVFHSSYFDINDVQSILRLCSMIYLSIDESDPPVDRNSKDTFICRYKFDTKSGVSPLKSSEIVSFSSLSAKRRSLLAQSESYKLLKVSKLGSNSSNSLNSNKKMKTSLGSSSTNSHDEDSDDDDDGDEDKKDDNNEDDGSDHDDSNHNHNHEIDSKTEVITTNTKSKSTSLKFSPDMNQRSSRLSSSVDEQVNDVKIKEDSSIAIDSLLLTKGRKKPYKQVKANITNGSSRNNNNNNNSVSSKNRKGGNLDMNDSNNVSDNGNVYLLDKNSNSNTTATTTTTTTTTTVNDAKYQPSEIMDMAYQLMCENLSYAKHRQLRAHISNKEIYKNMVESLWNETPSELKIKYIKQAKSMILGGKNNTIEDDNIHNNLDMILESNHSNQRRSQYRDRKYSMEESEDLHESDEWSSGLNSKSRASSRLAQSLVRSIGSVNSTTMVSNKISKHVNQSNNQSPSYVLSDSITEKDNNRDDHDGNDGNNTRNLIYGHSNSNHVMFEDTMDSISDKNDSIDNDTIFDIQSNQILFKRSNSNHQNNSKNYKHRSNNHTSNSDSVNGIFNYQQVYNEEEEDGSSSNSNSNNNSDSNANNVVDNDDNSKGIYELTHDQKVNQFNRRRGRPYKQRAPLPELSSRYSTRASNIDNYFKILESGEDTTSIVYEFDENKHTRVDPNKYQVSAESIPLVQIQSNTFHRPENIHYLIASTVAQRVWDSDKANDKYNIISHNTYPNLFHNKMYGKYNNIYEEYLIHAHDTICQLKYEYFCRPIDNVSGRRRSRRSSRSNGNDQKVVIDGSIILTKYNADDMLLEILHRHKYEISDALDDIETNISAFLVKWTLEEQRKIIEVFIKSGDDMPALIKAVPEKDPKDVMDYFFRCIYSAVQLQDVDIRAINQKKVIYSAKYGNGDNQYRDASSHGNDTNNYNGSNGNQPNGFSNNSNSSSSSSFSSSSNSFSSSNNHNNSSRSGSPVRSINKYYGDIYSNTTQSSNLGNNDKNINIKNRKPMDDVRTIEAEDDDEAEDNLLSITQSSLRSANPSINGKDKKKGTIDKLIHGDFYAKGHLMVGPDNEDITFIRVSHPYSSSSNSSSNNNNYTVNNTTNTSNIADAAVGKQLESEITTIDMSENSTEDTRGSRSVLKTLQRDYTEVENSSNIGSVIESVNTIQARIKNAMNKKYLQEEADSLQLNLKFLMAMRTQLDDSSYMDMFNALICYHKHILSTAELIVRIKMIDNQSKLCKIDQIKESVLSRQGSAFSIFADTYFPPPLHTFLASSSS